MKKISLSIFCIVASLYVSAQGKTYYVSPEGNDNASGLSVKDAWKSINRVNSVTFQPGDKILFEGGKTFYGQLKVKGSGEEGRPILMSGYGKGRPIINFGSAEGAGILINNESYWEVIGMEVSSYAPPEVGIGRQGIVVTAQGHGHVLKHFVIKDCYVHDIWGQLGGQTQYVGYNSCGILVRIINDRSRNQEAGAPRTDYVPSTIDDVLIEGNRIERMDKCGIISWGPRNNVVVRGNYMDNLGGDGIFVNGPYRGLIEYNEIHRSCMRSGDPNLPGDDGWWPHVAACWIQNTEETIMQFNEVYDTGRNLHNGDGFAYDFDFNCKRCIAQYNYSKNNHGLMLLMYNIFENVTRYNISENDRTHLVQMQGSRLKDGNLIYNNVFYVDYGMADLDFFRGTYEVDELGAYFYNNIFYATGQGRFRTVYTRGDTAVREYDEETRPNLPSGSIFLHNCYFGPWKNGIPDDPEALVADPKFVAPGTGGIGLASLAGYMLQPDSPCINTGMYVPNAGARDFFGNLLEDGHPDFGAFEQPGSGVFPDGSEAQKDEIARQASSIAWAKWMFPDVVASNSPEGPTIRLREPLEPSIQGTVTWVADGQKKPVVVNLSKLKDRQQIVLPIKADQVTLESSKLKVVLSNERFSEEWEIPFREVQHRRR
ncbi:MAG: right-handed parallel beta-helix repeat-containing protein [Candidatus Cryptobacteroides sp.]|jgi:hypothetical protein